VCKYTIIISFAKKNQKKYTKNKINTYLRIENEIKNAKFLLYFAKFALVEQQSYTKK